MSNHPLVRLWSGVSLALIVIASVFAQGLTARAAVHAVREPVLVQPPAHLDAPRQLSDAAAAGRFLGHVDPSMRLSVSLLLKGRHLDEIPGLLMAQADPRSPMFRHWLTPQQYGAYFGATPEQVQQTLDFLRSRGFTISVVTPNNRYIVARAPVRTVEATFATSIDMWSSSKGLYYANRFTPAVPSSLSWVQGITGLDSYHLVHSHMIVGSRGGSPHPQATVIPGHFSFGPQDLYTAYDFNPSYTGTGKAIALQVVRNFLLSDEFSYDSQFSISNASFTKVFLDGTCASPCPIATSLGDAGETALDTEVSHAAAPAAALTVVSSNDRLSSSQLLAFQYIANVLASKVQAVSSSYGLCESNVDPAARDGMVAAIDQGVLEGQVWVAAAGDDGSNDCKSGLQDVDFPASAPHIIAAGGTTLNTVNFLGNVVSYSSEYAWNDSGCGAGVGGATGGGVSRFFGKPAWQNLVTFSDGVRDVPDIAAEADPFQQTSFPANCPTGGGYWVITEGTWQQVGGTSAAAPLWAGIFADLSQEQRGNLGLVHPALYKLKGTLAFHKITIGNNAFGGVAGYPAGAGYNRVTGLGSPDETQLLKKFAETLPPTPEPTAFPGLFPHPTSTPVAKPTARAFIPIELDAKGLNDIGVFNATVGAGQGGQVQILLAAGRPIDIAPATSGAAVYVLRFGGAIDKITTNVKPYTYLANVFTTGAGNRVGAMAVKGTYAYVTNWFDEHVVKLNLTSGLSTPITVGHGASAIAPNPVATALYFTNTGDGTVGVINSTTNLLVQTFKVGVNPTRIGVNHAGTMAYVVNSGDGTISPVALGATAVPGTPVYVGGEPTSIAISSNDAIGFVTNLFCPETTVKCSPTGNNSLGVVEVLTLKTHPIGVECCIIVGQGPVADSFEPTGHYVWVINGGSNSVTIIDSFTNLVIGTFSTTPGTYSEWEASSRFIQTTPK